MAAGDTVVNSQPVVGASSNTWGTELNTYLTEIATSLAESIPIANISVTTDLDFNLKQITDVRALQFDNQSSSLTSGHELKIYTVGGDLYFTDGSSIAIALTSGGVAIGDSAANGITGAGYTAGSKEINWDNTNLTYLFKSGSGADDYAAIRSTSLEINDGSSNKLTHTVGAMGADYTVTWPTAVPSGNNAAISVSTSGTLAYTNTPSYTGITIGSTGVAHGDRELLIAPSAAFRLNNQSEPDFNGAWKWTGTPTTTSQYIYYPIPLKAGDQIKSISLAYAQDATTTLSVDLLEHLFSAPCDGPGTVVTGWFGLTSTGSDSSATYTKDGTDYTLLTDATYMVSVRPSGSFSNTLICGGLTITYDRP